MMPKLLRALSAPLAAVAITLALTLAAPAAFAESKTFQAEPVAQAAAPAQGDYRAMLAECDRQLEACKTDAVGVPYLGAAYLALWIVLVSFLFVVRRGQRRLLADVYELRERVASVREKAS